ncbi:hypothetical protein K438DRAFT_1778672 [Mycena galopus ATCC 62051]|nr:hypothetical protein K438DRAFT_1778672 [Mycena galopus ATCC 62051]
MNQNRMMGNNGKAFSFSKIEQSCGSCMCSLRTPPNEKSLDTFSGRPERKNISHGRPALLVKMSFSILPHDRLGIRIFKTPGDESPAQLRLMISVTGIGNGTGGRSHGLGCKIVAREPAASDDRNIFSPVGSNLVSIYLGRQFAPAWQNLKVKMYPFARQSQNGISLIEESYLCIFRFIAAESPAYDTRIFTRLCYHSRCLRHAQPPQRGVKQRGDKHLVHIPSQSLFFVRLFDRTNAGTIATSHCFRSLASAEYDHRVQVIPDASSMFCFYLILTSKAVTMHSRPKIVRLNNDTRSESTTDLIILT